MGEAREGGWVAVREAKHTWRTFRHDWLAIPRERRKRFALTLTFGWIATTLLALAMSLGVRALLTPEMEAAERGWLERIVEAAPFDFESAIFFESPGNGVILISLATALSIIFARRRRPLWSLGILAACLMAALVVGAGWIASGRDRPDFLYEGLPASGLSSFPSGHAAMSIPTYGFLLYLGVRHSASRLEKLAAALVLVLVVGILSLSRFVLSAHWPSDIAGGTLLGAIWLAVVIVALRRGERRDPEEGYHARPRGGTPPARSDA